MNVAKLPPDVANLQLDVPKFALDDANCGRRGEFCAGRVANCWRFATPEPGQEAGIGMVATCSGMGAARSTSPRLRQQIQAATV